MPRTPRRFPRWGDLAPLIRFRRPAFGRRHRLAQAHTIEELRAMARRRTPRAAFDYTDGAADAEISLERARATFRELTFHPEILRDVSTLDTSVEILGATSRLPFGIAPTGFTRLMHTEGEIAGAVAAQRAGIPYTLSTMATTSLEDVAAAAPGVRRWFQLYMWTDRERSIGLVDRAAAAGYDTLVVTVDVPVAGARLRDVRNGMTIPPTLTPRTVLDAIPRPRWWVDLLTTPPLTFASLNSWSGTIAELLDAMFDPSVSFDDLAWLRERWPGKLVVKGIQTVEDARRAVDAGADAVVLSNHGGRQLDRAPVPLTLLPETRAALGTDAEIILDTGIMHGQDIAAALALGADFVLIGRAYLYGLMAGGLPGVERSIDILETQLARTMRLLGARSVAELAPRHVTLPRSLP
ncbi:alpha-hydroxy-acid oxidizing protein [Pimelobacter simplex]|uniref:Alpha-hydroxy-acid oxidizing protein n=1 Tax=Nocardioides simplex TaxID=2045 RepID=A0A7J5E5M8_NOCSI|nr:alpha-hydroxy acid oxidase [Pimelobacter simplex]KAB2813588.1 alpha-hydroxy-acid oxidizing protein [Pimelobacter simplex]